MIIIYAQIYEYELEGAGITETDLRYDFVSACWWCVRTKCKPQRPM